MLRSSWRPRAAPSSRCGSATASNCSLPPRAPGPPTTDTLNSPLFYQLLRAHGDLGPDAPAAIEMFSGRGQPSCEALIDRYRIACRPVRDVLVDYLRERQPSVDFSSLQNAWPTCWANCSGPIWRPTTPASTRCSCPAMSPRRGSNG